MTKLMSIIVGGALGLTLAASVGAGIVVGSNSEFRMAEAASTTLTFSSQGYSNQQAVSSATSGQASFTFDKGSNSNAPKYYNSGKALRMYGGNTMTVSVSDTYLISAITITFGSSDGTNEITTNVGTYSSGSWSGSSTSIVFTIGGTTGNRRFSAVAVTYAQNTNPTVILDNPTIEMGSNNTTGTVVTATTKNLTNPTFAWTTNDANVSLENASSNAVTIKPNTNQGGTATVTCTATAGNKSASASVAVSIYHQPYTVAEARAAIDASKNLENVLTSGIIYQIDSYNSTYHSLTYWISDDGTSSNPLQIYSGKGLDNANFSSVDDIAIGAQVTICGTLKKYNSTYEYDKNNYQTYYLVKTISSISISGAMTKTIYSDGSQWNPAGLVVTAHYNDNTTGDITTGCTWSYNPATPTLGTTSVIATATFEGFTVSSSAQAVTVATTPYTNGLPYKMYLVNTQLNNTYYFTGAMGTGQQQYYGATSTTKSEGVDVYFENHTGGGQNLYFMDGSTKNYLYVSKSTTDGTTHYNFAFGTSVPSIGWGYNGTCIIYELDDTFYTFATYGNYTTFGASPASYNTNYTVEFILSDSVSAETFAQEFLNNMTCDATGASAPTFASGYTWADFQVTFSQLPSSEQTTLQNATANESGTVVEQAMARYDYVVAKYSYNNFINRSIGNSANRMNGIIDNNRVVPLTAVLGLLSTTAFAAFYMLRKKKLA